MLGGLFSRVRSKVKLAASAGSPFKSARVDRLTATALACLRDSQASAMRPGFDARASSGQVMVLVAMGLVTLIGFAALAVDVGQFWTARRDLQTAADAAAVAGAIALRVNGNAAAAADTATAANGFTNGDQGVTVTVNNPPAGGSYAGNPKYVEVVVSRPEPAYFMRVLGYDTVNVSARSVAASMNGPACVYALDPSVSGAITISGSSSVSLSCGVIDDSNDSTALNSNGGATLTTTADIGVAGGYSGSGFSPTPVTRIAPAPDPLSYLQAPSVGSCDYTNLHVGTTKGTTYLNHGVYCGGIQVSGNNPVVFNPGLYILDGGGLKVTASNANISGTGVTFYNTQGYSAYGPIALSGSNQANLSAPTSGPYAGILFYQDRSIPVGSKGSTITGSSGSTFDGAIYFPTTAVSYSGSSSSDGYTIIVGDTISVSGNSVLGDNYSSLANGSPIRSTALYE
jgi:Putative Flp pilus-assembly TadE/G-like